MCKILGNDSNDNNKQIKRNHSGKYLLAKNAEVKQKDGKNEKK